MSTPRILVVEDNPIALKLYRLTLESQGYTVYPAADAGTALALLEATAPDLVVQDLLLPDMDGFVLLQRIRSHPAGAGVPVFAISGLATKMGEARAQGLSFAGYLVKPVEPAQLLRAIRGYLPAAGPAGADVGAGRRIVVADDDPIMRKLLTIRLRQLGFEVAATADGREALAALRQAPTEAVVSDILMPNLDGFALCQAIRQDPQVARVPVVLTTAAYIDEADRKLSERAGASAFVLRTPGLQPVIDALLASLATPVPDRAPAAAVEPELFAEHSHRVARQLEHQISLNASLTDELAVQRAQLSILAGIAGVLATRPQIETILEELLTRCLESSGFFSGAIYLAGPDGILSLQVQHSQGKAPDPHWLDQVARAGLLERALPAGEPIWLPLPPAEPAAARAAANPAWSAVAMPLRSGQRCLGVLVMASTYPQAEAEALAYFRAVGGQLSQAIALGQSLDQLAASEHGFRSIAETAADGIIQTGSGGEIIYMNPAAERLVTYPDGSALGQPLAALLPAVSGEPGSWESDGIRREGGRFPTEGTTRLHSDRYGRARCVHVLRDLTERRKHEQQLLHLADRDPLTGLFNRRRLLGELERQLAEARTHGTGGALLLLNVDQFKYVNDELGPQTGDLALQHIAALLQQWHRPGDTLARLGGDEFAVLLPHADEGQALGRTEELLRVISGSLHQVDERLERTTASAGIALLVPDLNAESVLTRAELALTDAKESGRNRFSFYRPDARPGRRSGQTLTWRERISSALAQDRFELHFQPLIDVRSGDLLGFEALLRMLDPDGRRIAPGEFLDVATRFSLMAELDRWVVRRAVATLAEQRRAGMHRMLWVNLSARAFDDPELVSFILETMQRLQVPPGELCFEITETDVIANLVRAREMINCLHQAGCRFALDDFGTGFCSFNYLKHLPVDMIKIDGSFIRELPRSTMDQHVVRAIVGVARGLGKHTIAEFVEDRETLRVLSDFGVDAAQGFYIGEPRNSWQFDRTPEGTRLT